MELAQKIFNLLSKINPNSAAGLLKTAYKEFPELALRMFDSIASLKPQLAHLILKVLPTSIRNDILGVQETTIRTRLAKMNHKNK